MTRYEVIQALRKAGKGYRWRDKITDTEWEIESTRISDIIISWKTEDGEYGGHYSFDMDGLEQAISEMIDGYVFPKELLEMLRSNSITAQGVEGLGYNDLLLMQREGDGQIHDIGEFFSFIDYSIATETGITKLHTTVFGLDGELTINHIRKTITFRTGTKERSSEQSYLIASEVMKRCFPETKISEVISKYIDGELEVSAR